MSTINMKKFFYSDGDKFLKNFSDFLSKRNASNKSLSESVDQIISNVRDNGDVALAEYTKKFDKVDVNKLGFYFHID